MSMQFPFQQSALVAAIASIDTSDSKPVNVKQPAQIVADDGADWNDDDDAQPATLEAEPDDADEDIVEAINLPPLSDEERRARANELRRMIGQRMRAARELCLLGRDEAARMLGLTAQQLERFEGTVGRGANHPEIVAAANLYEVSTDYLYGITQEFETDFSTAQRRAAGAWLFQRFEQNWRDQLAKFAQLDRRLEKFAWLIEAMAVVADENAAAIASLRARNPEFDDMRGGATVVRLAEQLVRRGTEGRALLKRFCTEAGAAG